ncbi:sensor histidine kinase [Catenulispora subtropica]|uniref:histidine kinase n=1 Tax=Catenulispora subtropica TaxID=450798 RepID=A0ABP5CR83_9ACTN
MRITRRLGVLVAVPLAAVSGFGAVALTASAGETMRGEHLWSLMHTATAAGQLICELQDERTMMALLLTGPDPRPTSDVEAQIAQTDAAIADYRRQVRALPHTPQVTRDLLARIDQELTQLSTLRAQVRSQSAPALSAVAFQYRIAIADLAAFREAVTTAGSAPQQIATKIHAANLLYQAAESTGLEETDVLRSATGQPLTPAAVAAIARDRQGYGDAMETFDIQAPAEWHERPDEAMTSPDILTAGQYEDQVSRLGAGDTLKIDKGVWARSMSTRRDALDEVRENLDLTTLTAIAQLRDHARRTAEAEAAAVAGTALLVVMISLRLGRPMIRGLRQLRDAAHAVAFERLPAAVEELRATESLTGRSPEEFADQAGDALTLGGRTFGGRRRDPIRPDDAKDELAAVARAFNSVHREAIRTAAEQVLLRAGVGATFVALARRGERLTGALTSELDRAERAEQDPDRLARLFVLDHLAARMTRNNESLLVLGGEGTARVRDRGVPLLDVARAALGRIERYTRVDLESVESGIVIAPQAVDHLVHLCAELLDNATTYSAPGSRVTVGARRMTDRVIVQIADRGIGMTPARRAELNARLAAPRQVDSETVRAMGLTVVAHLAAWYGIEVELRARPGGGTVAEVALPLTVVAPEASQDSDTPGATIGRVHGATGGIKDAAPLSALGEPVAEPDAADWPELPFPETELAEYRPPADIGRPAPAYTALASRLSEFRAPDDRPAAVNGADQPAAGTPAAVTAATTPATATTPTTLNGLPVRVPQTKLPKEARRGAAAPQDPDPTETKAPADRDPERVAATMAAYARGLTGRGGPKP